MRESFWDVYRPGCWEHYVLHVLRGHPDYVPELALVAEEDGAPAAYVGAHVAADEASINNVATDPQYRRRGLAEALLRELMARAEKQGVRKYSLEVRVGNAAAIALYTKLGFEPVGVRRRYYSHPQEDALIMIKELL